MAGGKQGAPGAKQACLFAAGLFALCLWGCSEDASTEVAFADVCHGGVPQRGWTYTSRNEGPPGRP
jgi:hypothetical protein